MYSCNYCSKTYAWPDSLRRHIKHAHDPAQKTVEEASMETEPSVKSPGSVTTEPSTMEQHEVSSSAFPPVRESKLIKIGDRKYVSIRSYGGEPRVNIRQYIHDSHGRPYSTKRGILLTPTEWHQLTKNFKDIDNCLIERIK